MTQGSDCFKNEINKILSSISSWQPPQVPESIPQGDMPGDKIKIGSDHINKANIIFPKLLELLLPVFESSLCSRAVVTVCGGSGVGKSEIASLLTFYLNSLGIGSYTLSGDNYPHRIPKYNDAERLRIFRCGGIKALLTSGLYKQEAKDQLRELQLLDEDSNPAQISKHPWLSVYQRGGRSAIKSYLGTDKELDFNELTNIVSLFKNGAPAIMLKRMGREETELWYDDVDFSNINVLIIEWTHGNSDGYQGVDIPILLNSTPQETLEHRRSRNRDGKTDSPFTTMVLEIEQELLVSQAAKAKLIISKSGELLSYDEYRLLMART
ncbi:MAG: adenylylsulfate kinase [Papillibacter sp.]|nr:adenylylsulfate kinase [Papillibacter sp.]